MQISSSKNIVLSPDSEWTRIMAEESERQSLIRYGISMNIVAYALLFAFSFVFSAMISTLLPFSATHVVASVVVQFLLSVASIYIVPQVLASIAPNFGGENNALNALKLFVFASTPAWLGMAVAVIPIIGWLAALAGGLYAIYLFWKHFAEAMSIPEDKKISYLVTAVLLLIVVNVAIGVLGRAVSNMVAPLPGFHI
jgi:hypothetical protein